MMPAVPDSEDDPLDYKELLDYNLVRRRAGARLKIKD